MILLIFRTIWVVGGSTSRIAIVGAFCSKFNLIDGVEFGGSKHDSVRTYLVTRNMSEFYSIQVQSLRYLWNYFSD